MRFLWLAAIPPWLWATGIHLNFVMDFSLATRHTWWGGFPLVVGVAFPLLMVTFLGVMFLGFLAFYEEDEKK